MKNIQLAKITIFLFSVIFSSCSKSGPSERRPGGIITNPPNSPGIVSSPAPYNCSFWVGDINGLGDTYSQVASALLTLTVDAETKTLFYYLDSAPISCGLPVTLNFNLPAGLHTWTATSINGSRSTSGSILITAGGCSIKEIVF